MRPESKAVSILLSVKPETASAVLAQFEAASMEALAQAAASTCAISDEELATAAVELAETLGYSRSTIVQEQDIGGLLAAAAGYSRAEEILAKAYGRPSPSIWDRLVATGSARLKKFLEQQGPWTAAAVIWLMPDEQAATLLHQMDARCREKVLTATLSIRRGAIEESQSVILAAIENIVSGERERAAIEQVREKVASLCAGLDSDFVEKFLEDIESQDPEAAEAMKKGIFQFGDIALLDSGSRRTLVEKCSPDDLGTALIGCDDELAQLMLSALPARTRRMIEQDIEASAVTRSSSDIEKARTSICREALMLRKAGKIHDGRALNG